MRRAAVCAILAFVLAASGLISAFWVVNGQQDDVAYTPNTLWGDPAAAEGVEVSSLVHYDQRLFWDVEITVGEEPVCESRFTRFSSFQDLPRKEVWQGVELESYAEGASWHFDETGAKTSLGRAYEELYAMAKPGEEVKMEVALADYFEYYPISGLIDVPGCNFAWSEIFELDYGENMPPREELNVQERTILTMQEFFKIPVLEGHKRELSLALDMEGRIYSTGSAWLDGDAFYISTLSAVAGDACYFTFVPRSTEDVVMDTSHIPGGYGIYRLPFETDGEGNTVPVPEELSMVYPLEPEVYVHELRVADGDLLIASVDEGVCALTVVNLADMETRQRVEFARGEMGLWDLQVYDSFLTLRTGDGRLALFSRSKGEYRLEFVVASSAEDVPGMNVESGSAMAWDGERLAVCSRAYLGDYWGELNASFQLAVYDATGLVYAGVYSSTLDTGRDDHTYDYRCMTAKAGLSVTFS